MGKKEKTENSSDTPTKVDLKSPKATKPAPPKTQTTPKNNNSKAPKTPKTPKTPQTKTTSTPKNTPKPKSPAASQKPETPVQTPKANNNNNKQSSAITPKKANTPKAAPQNTPQQKTQTTPKNKTPKAAPQNTPQKKQTANQASKQNIKKDTEEESNEQNKSTKSTPQKNNKAKANKQNDANNNNNNNTKTSKESKNKDENKMKIDSNGHSNKDDNNDSVTISQRKKNKKRRRTEEENKETQEQNSNNKRQKRVYTITVANLSSAETKESIEKHFSSCGTIVGMRLKHQMCFIDFDDIAGYQSALELNQTALGNSILTVSGSFRSAKSSFPPSKYLFVSNLTQSTTEKQLIELFKPFGQVDRVELVKDKITGALKGFAFIVMNSIAAAQSALSLSSTLVDNRQLRVEFHAPRFDKVVDGKVKVSLVDVHSRRKSRVKRELRNASQNNYYFEKILEDYEDTAYDLERQKNKELEKERDLYRAANVGDNDFEF